MRKLIAATAAITLVSCSSFNSKVVDPLITDLSKISNTAATDLNTVIATANAATPPDVDGANCAKAALTVQGQVAAVVKAANVSGAGAFTAAELASLFQPGSAQYNQAAQTLNSGCAAKAADVLTAAGALAAGGAVGALAVGQLLPLAAAS